MSGIKRYLPTCDCMGQSSLGDYVRHTDHLASHAFDEAVERAAFEAEMVLSGVNCTRRTFGSEAEDMGLFDGDYYGREARTGWYYWKACAKSRANRFGGDV